MLILQGDRNLLEQAELSQLLLAPAPLRMKSVEAAESPKGTLPDIVQNRVSPHIFLFFDLPLLLGITAENIQHPSPTGRSIKQVSSA